MAHQAPRFSVLIPTYNRAAYLARCLSAMAEQTAERACFEIIVIDNNSPDETRARTMVFASEHPELSLRYVWEPRQSAGYARNRGVAEARGEILCFLDDDAVARPDWLERLAEGFADPTVGCVGGPALPDYQGQQRPSWLFGDLQGLLSGYNLHFVEPTLLTRQEQFPFACNMALRRAVFDQVGLFRPDLDRIGKALLTGGETELIGRASRSGWKVLYVPGAVVSHLMPPERLEKRYLYRIGYGMAASHVILTSERRASSTLRWFASDLWYTTRMFFRLCVALLSGKALWFDDYMRFWIVSLRLPLRLRLVVRGSIA